MAEDRSEAEPKTAPSPLAATVRGVLAGIAGTAAMTGAQRLATELASDGEDTQSEAGDRDPWAEAPAPARVLKRIGEGLFDLSPSADLIPTLTQVAHWGYGTGWGVVYTIATARRRRSTLRRGMAFGTLVWAASYALLVPMRVYSPPWEYEPQELELDLFYHLAYGAGVGAALRILDR